MKTVVRYTIKDTQETKEEVFTSLPDARQYERSLADTYGDLIKIVVEKAPKPAKKERSKED